ncbi:MAG: UDP-N-acetylmuramoyl-L-alanyl-D-glutamate--2,6-diaminopimelate ligase [Candidatus Gottesmanbacteria bacterium]
MPRKFKNIYHLFVAILATVFFRYPAKNLIVIGVTGTDGKTTTVNLIYEMLKNAGKKVAMISSVGAKIGGKDYDLPFHVTTPSPWQLQKFIRLAVDRGDKYLVLEVTSHGLDQNRVFGCNFKIGVITNVTHEHLDYHKTYENYVMTKAKLFKGVEWAIINKDDKSFDNLKFEIRKLKITKILSYGLEQGDITLSKFLFHTPLPGKYNQQNCLAAIATCKTLGINDDKIRETLAGFKGVLGRFDFLKTNRDFRVMIDFAHTPNALEQVLSTIRPDISGKIIHVFGCAGLRDKEKRPIMGEIAAKYDDIIILTEEDYRTEDNSQIMCEIEKGVIQNRKFMMGNAIIYKISDRQDAINKAISLAQKDDLLILTGKGHEKSLCRGTNENPWSDYVAVNKALSQL